MRSCPARLLLRGHCQRGRVQGTRRSEGGSGKEPGELAPMGGQRPEQALTLGCPGPPGQSHELAPQCGALLILPLQGGHEWLPRKEPLPAWRTSGPGSPLPTPGHPPLRTGSFLPPAARMAGAQVLLLFRGGSGSGGCPMSPPPSLQTTQQQAVICCPAECLPLAGASSAQLQLYKERRESQAGGWTGGGECPCRGVPPSRAGPGLPKQEGARVSCAPRCCRRGPGVPGRPAQARRVPQAPFAPLFSFLGVRRRKRRDDAGAEGAQGNGVAARGSWGKPTSAGGGESREGWTEVAQLEGGPRWKIW